MEKQIEIIRENQAFLKVSISNMEMIIKGNTKDKTAIQCKANKTSEDLRKFISLTNYNKKLIPMLAKAKENLNSITLTPLEA
jgi:hypothetical protein